MVPASADLKLDTGYQGFDLLIRPPRVRVKGARVRLLQPLVESQVEPAAHMSFVRILGPTVVSLFG